MHLYASLEEGKVQNIKLQPGQVVLFVFFLPLLFNQKMNITVILKTEMVAFKQLANNRVEHFKRKMGRISAVGTPC